MRVLIINTGSSSIKFAVYQIPPERRELAGTLVRIGQPEGSFRLKDASGATIHEEKLTLPDHQSALRLLAESLGKSQAADAIGHRIVHGGQRYREPQIITSDVIKYLRELIPLAPNHLPPAIAAIEAITRLYPHTDQVACFDTSFHRDMPEVAQVYPLPEAARANGKLIRYGFHGLSYEYIVSELERAGGPHGRTIICHLGNGASMAAVRDGKSLDTTMGLTPTGGLVMSTRCGDIDPEVVLYLIEQLRMDAVAARDAITQLGGMLGLSGFSGDMQDLHQRESQDPKAALAVAVFCYSARKGIGSLAAILSGLDTLVFTGGIGENDAVVRARICEGLDFMGLRIDPARNEKAAPVISPADTPVSIRVIKTNEELMIARHTNRLVRAGKA